MTTTEFFALHQDEINKAFGTNIDCSSVTPKVIEAIQWCFDVYSSEEEVLSALGITPDDLESYIECGGISVIDGNFVVFSEVNWNWNDMCAVNSETGENIIL